jgi:hypothetical protein
VFLNHEASARMIGPGISDPVAVFAFRQNHAGEGGGFSR